MHSRAEKKVQKRFIKKAKKEGIKLRKNNIDSAKPLHSICGFISTKHPAPIEELVEGR